MCAAPLKRFLGASDALSRLQDHAARLVRMQRQLEATLPANMRGGVSVANFDLGTLTLHAATPALAARLKMSQETLRNDFLALNEPVQDIKVKVRPIHSSERHALYATQERRIGESGKNALKELEEKLGAESPLGLALKRMREQSR
ncbi:DciA family protein [Uliginosibacterium sp. H3]|uniref:DciA family protein n=1 Tax=Uliginosibacterium silvisoli TaxID=3114758 RepID=A0ABU6K2B1_9RHOO|nr:DciA family protein [Uliginosibacterium sp. H3]